MQVQGKVIKKGAKNFNLYFLKNKESFYSENSVFGMVDHPRSVLVKFDNASKFSENVSETLKSM